MRKRTTLITNSGAVVRAFADCMCRGDHEHQRIMGKAEGGEDRSSLAAVYPERMRHALARAFTEDLRIPAFGNK